MFRKRNFHVGGSKKDISVRNIRNIFYKSDRAGGIRAAKHNVNFSGPGRNTADWILTFNIINRGRANVNLSALASVKQRPPAAPRPMSKP